MKTLLDDVVLGTLPDAMLHDMEIHRNNTTGLGQSSQIWRSLHPLAVIGSRPQLLDRNSQYCKLRVCGGCEVVVTYHTSLAANTGLSSCATPTVNEDEWYSMCECGEGCGTH